MNFDELIRNGEIPVTVIHHRDLDGYGGAWAFDRYFESVNYGGEITFISAQYGEPAPEINGGFVIIVDFSYDREILENWNTRTDGVLLLDHHKSAKSKLEDLPYCNFGDRAGCVMACRFLRPDREIPKFLKYIEDRDLWKWELPYSKEIIRAMDSYPLTMKTVRSFEFRMGTVENFHDLVSEGKAIQRMFDILIERAIETKHFINIGVYKIPAVNTHKYIRSELGEKLAEGQPFAAVYWFDGENIKFSLRSDKNGLDVSEIAAEHGGGGHKHAASFSKSVKEFSGWCD
jgi:oligoribonuclease NrnB/cAMP/cGMP phosphodiesterase (DHH superfamily)